MGQNRIREIANILNSTARTNKYRLSFSYPTGVSGISNLAEVDVICKGTTAPGRELGVIEIWNQGRKHRIPGDTAYDGSWSVDFHADEEHTLRSDMVKWQTACDDFHRNVHAGLPNSVMTDLRLEQLDSAGNVSAQYTMHNSFPTTIGEITYGDDSADTPAEFNVTFSYTDWVLGSGEENDFTPHKATLNPTSFDA
jgi:hypothetical protein